MKKLLLFLCWAACAAGAADKKISDLATISTLTSNSVLEVGYHNGSGWIARKTHYGLLEAQFRTNKVAGATNADFATSATSAAASTVSTTLLDELPGSYTNQVVFSPRADNIAGDGRALRPFDASTASKLHAAWDNVFGGARSNLTVTFLPGRYVITNKLTIPAGSRQLTISGYGAAIVISNFAASGGVRFIDVVAPNCVTNVSVAGFDIDAGSQVTLTAAGASGGIQLNGYYLTVEDVTVRNIENYSGTEAFGFILGGTNLVLRNSSVLEPNGNYISGAALVGADGEVSGCTFAMGATAGSSGRYGISPYLQRGIVVNNIVRGVDNAIHCDSAGGADALWGNVVVSGNVLESYNIGFRFDVGTNHTYGNWTFKQNSVRSLGAVGKWAYLFSSQITEPVITNFVFTGNDFCGTPAASQNFYMTVPPVTTGLVIDGNTWSVTPNFPGNLDRWGGTRKVVSLAYGGRFSGNVVVNNSTLGNFSQTLVTDASFTLDSTYGRVTNLVDGALRVTAAVGRCTNAVPMTLEVYTNGVATGITAYGNFSGGEVSTNQPVTLNAVLPFIYAGTTVQVYALDAGSVRVEKYFVSVERLK